MINTHFNKHWLRYFMFLLLGYVFYSNQRRSAFITKQLNRIDKIKGFFGQSQSGIHIQPLKHNGYNWQVKLDGKTQKGFMTKAEAMPYATKLAEVRHKNLFIHDRQGHFKIKRASNE